MWLGLCKSELIHRPKRSPNWVSCSFSLPIWTFICSKLFTFWPKHSIFFISSSKIKFGIIWYNIFHNVITWIFHFKTWILGPEPGVVSLEKWTYKSQGSLEQVSILQTQDLPKKIPITGEHKGWTKMIARAQKDVKQSNDFPLKQRACLNLSIVQYESDVPNSASPIKHAGSKIATSPVDTRPEFPIWWIFIKSSVAWPNQHVQGTGVPEDPRVLKGISPVQSVENPTVFIKNQRFMKSTPRDPLFVRK